VTLQRGNGPIDIHLLGVNHFDPAQPEAVASTLRQLQAKYGETPAFAAVEADEQLHETVSAQRVVFCQLLMEEWPNLTEIELAKLSASFLFEAEAHRHVWRDVPIVWLDADRTLDSHAEFRIELFKWWRKGKSLHDSLPELGKKAWEVAGPNCDLSRSQAFHKRMLDAIKNYTGKWSFVVVGAAHTDVTREGTMANLLAKREELSVHCHVLR
jgi:hypothetical protein